MMQEINFRSVHPTQGAAKRHRSSGGRAEHGLRADQDSSTEGYCKQCGFPYDLKKQTQGIGNGIKHIQREDSEGVYQYVDVGSGCRFCGSHNLS